MLDAHSNQILHRFAFTYLSISLPPFFVHLLFAKLLQSNVNETAFFLASKKYQEPTLPPLPTDDAQLKLTNFYLAKATADGHTHTQFQYDMAYFRSDTLLLCIISSSFFFSLSSPPSSINRVGINTAPEQILSQRDYTVAVDVYQAGVLMFRLMTQGFV